MIKKPAVLSAVGVAASIVVAVGFFLPVGTGPTVQAATIIQKLDEQIQQNPRIEVTIDSLSVDEVFVNGTVQISEQGVAGDMAVQVYDQPGGELEVEVDLSLGITDDGGWVLLRKLVVPDPKAQAMLAMFMPPGGEILLLLPKEALDADIGADVRTELGSLNELQSGELVSIFQQLIEAHADYGINLVNQADGTVLLSLSIDDAEALAGFEQMLIASAGAAAEEAIADVTADADVEINLLDMDEGNELIGCTLSVVYDPATEKVRSFGIEGLGGPDSRINIVIGEGEIDPDLFDSDRVVTPSTRTFDLGALEAMFGQFDSEE